MFKDVVRTLDTGILPQIGLIAFFVAFTVIVLYAVLLTKKQADAHAQLPLSDEPFELRTPTPSNEVPA